MGFREYFARTIRGCIHGRGAPHPCYHEGNKMIHEPVDPAAGLAVALAWVALLAGMLLTQRPVRLSTPSGVAPRRDLRSLGGVVLQGVGIGAVWFGGFAYSPSRPVDWAAAAAPALLAITSLALFCWAAWTLGANWSLVARMRADHQLVRTGPFAFMRHPIYVAMFGMMAATALALHHTSYLIFAAPVFVVGTLLRTSVEERLLHDTFGAAYEDYARRVKRFIPALW